MKRKLCWAQDFQRLRLAPLCGSAQRMRNRDLSLVKQYVDQEQTRTGNMHV